MDNTDREQRRDPREPTGTLPIGQNQLTDYPFIYQGQSHSPRFRASPSASPLSKRPFDAGLEHSRFLLSPDRSLPDLNVGMDVSRYGSGRNPVYDSGQAAYNEQSDSAYNDRQSHTSLQMSDYHNSKNSVPYFGLTPQDVGAGSYYGRSVLDNSHFSRALPSISSLPENPTLAHNHLDHFNRRADEFARDDLLERRLALASHGSISTTRPFDRIPENYFHRADSSSTAAASSLEMTAVDKAGTPVSTPQSPYIPFGSTPNYVGYSPSLYPFPHFSPSFMPESYGSYGASVNHPPHYGQYGAPPPAHTRFHEAPLQRSGLGGEMTQSLKGVSGKPVDATVIRENLTSSPQWNDINTTSSKRDFISDDKNLTHLTNPSGTGTSNGRASEGFENQSSVFRGEERHDKLSGNEFVPVGRKEKRKSVQSKMSEINRVPAEGQFPWTQANQMIADNKHMLPSSAGYSSSYSSVCSTTNSSSAVAGNAVQQPMFYGEPTKHGSSGPYFSVANNPSSMKSSSHIDAAENCPISHRNISNSSEYRVTSNVCFDSNESGEDTEVEDFSNFQKEDLVDSFPGTKSKMTTAFNQMQHKKEDGMSNEVDKSVIKFSGITPSISQTEGNVKGIQKNTFQETSKEPYDSSTSEYEPPSPYQAIRKGRKQASKKRAPAKKKSVAAISAEDVDDTVIEGIAPKIRLIIKKERGKEAQSGRNPRVRKLKRAKREASSVKPDKKGNRTCPICNKIFSRADSLTCHMRVHTGDRPYHCEYCGATYKVSSHLRDHIRSKHSDDKPFECERCGKPFTYSTARRRHEKICGKDLTERVLFQCANCGKGFVTTKGFSKHQMKCGVTKSDRVSTDSEKAYKCIACKKAFETFPGLKRHQRFTCRKSVQRGHYMCGECGKSFLKRNHYIVHIRRHTGKKPFRCGQCEACFFDKNALRRHMVQHDGNKNFRCSLCDAAFYLKRCLSLHEMSIHSGLKPYKCKECESDFPSGYKLSRHVRRVHSEGKRPKCALCGKKFSDASALKKHMQQHALKPNNSMIGRNLKEHTCKICNVPFLMKDFRAHITSEHPDVTVKEAMARQLTRCEICFKDFSGQESLRVHRLRHSGRRPWHCSQCDKAFVLKSALELHQRSHTDHRPHSCPECGKTFRWRASVSQHIIAHHTPKLNNSEDSAKKFSCHECGKKFKRQICLNVHLKRHHTVLPHIKRKHRGLPKQKWLCEECGKSLCRKDALQKHMELHAKHRDGPIPKSGRRKVGSCPPQSSMLSDPECASANNDIEFQEVRKEVSQGNTDVFPGMQNNFSFSTLHPCGNWSQPAGEMEPKSVITGNETGKQHLMDLHAANANMNPSTNMNPNPNMNPSTNMNPNPNMNPSTNMNPNPNMNPSANMNPNTIMNPSFEAYQPFPAPAQRYHYNPYVNHSIPCPSTAEY